ncbi:hypothetical protein M2388_002713 [Leucobacter aridicollis]|nr:hypothetical protein [Leucobacter aridicollis]
MNNGTSRSHTEETRGRLDPSSSTSSLEWRVERTYRARLETSKRMRARALTWNTLLVTSSTVTTVISIILLADPLAYGANGSALLVVVGVLAFAASLLVTSANHAARAETFFRGYRDLQRLWVKVCSSIETNSDAPERLEEEYQQLLDQLPNHSTADHLTADRKRMAQLEQDGHGGTQDEDSAPKKKRTWSAIRKSASEIGTVFLSNALTFLPIGVSAALVLLLIPAVGWLVP